MDRFIDWRAQGELGSITTRPLRLDGEILQVNVDSRGGRFYVEVLDADGQAIPGFSAAGAVRYDNVNELRLRPAWSDNSDLAQLRGRTVRLKFYLYNARLYSFQMLTK